MNIVNKSIKKVNGLLHESENIELKREETPELCKSVIAFANSHVR